jgi:hypothetical protein
MVHEVWLQMVLLMMASTAWSDEHKSGYLRSSRRRFDGVAHRTFRFTEV